MKRVFGLLLAVMVSLSIWGQSDGADEPTERTIEELYLSQDLELQIVRGYALSGDPEVKQLALQEIRSMVERGSLPDGVYIVLESLATEGTVRQQRLNGSIVNNFPLIRREAAELLGDIGGERAKDSLLRVVRDENEPVVLAEAAYQLGQIGLNDGREVSNYLVQTLVRENARQTPDNNLAFAIILALESISAQNGGLADPDVLEAMLDTASAPYIRSVRDRAIQAIVSMREHAG